MPFPPIHHTSYASPESSLFPASSGPAGLATRPQIASHTPAQSSCACKEPSTPRPAVRNRGTHVRRLPVTSGEGPCTRAQQWIAGRSYCAICSAMHCCSRGLRSSDGVESGGPEPASCELCLRTLGITALYACVVVVRMYMHSC